MTVLGRDLLHVRDPPLLFNVFGSEVNDAAKAVRFRAAHQELLAKLEIVHALRELKAQQRVAGVRLLFLFARQIGPHAHGALPHSPGASTASSSSK